MKVEVYCDGSALHDRMGIGVAVFSGPNWFQSSPVPEDGCNLIATGEEAVAAIRFNPHPSRRTGATSDRLL